MRETGWTVAAVGAVAGLWEVLEGEVERGKGEVSKLEVVIYKQDLEDVILALEWILNKQNFECDCEPHYEWDTNATIHNDNCALEMMGHIEAVLDNMRKFREATK